MTLPLNIDEYKYFDVLAIDESGNFYIRYSSWPVLLSGNKYTGEYSEPKNKMIKVSNDGAILAIFNFISSDIDTSAETIYTTSGDSNNLKVIVWKK